MQKQQQQQGQGVEKAVPAILSCPRRRWRCFPRAQKAARATLFSVMIAELNFAG